MSSRHTVDILSPAGVEFQHVSPTLAALRLGNAFALLCLWLIPAQVRALRYALAETDFVIRRGVINRSLTMVPYGRIQYVDIHQGPVLRFMGIATIKLSTASAQTDATLSGVSVADAVGLRDVLAERGSAELMGL